MKTSLALITLTISTFLASAEEMSQAKWCHRLLSNRLRGDKPSELWIHSNIHTGVLGYNASQRFGQDVKVTEWGKPFTVTSRVYQRADLDGAKYKEVFTVTLFEMEDPKEMRAEFEHVVYRNDKVYLRFAGVTIVDNSWRG